MHFASQDEHIHSSPMADPTWFTWLVKETVVPRASPGMPRALVTHSLRGWHDRDGGQVVTKVTWHSR